MGLSVDQRLVKVEEAMIEMAKTLARIEERLQALETPPSADGSQP